MVGCVYIDDDDDDIVVCGVGMVSQSTQQLVFPPKTVE
jgi:hypothetical protein